MTRLPAMPYPMNKGQEKRFWTTGNDRSKHADMGIKTIIILLVGLTLSPASFAEAQQPKKIPWIGYLATAGSSPNEAFLQGMRDLGYLEGKNIGFVYRTTEGNSERLPGIAAELVRLKVDIIFADGTGAALGAKKATSTIPIVMTSSTDPVGTGLVTSIGRPGGNVTGLASLSEELGGKMLELLKEIMPKINRVAILRPDSPADRIFEKNTQAVAQALQIYLIDLIVPGADEFEGAFQAVRKERANALLVRLPPRTPAAQRKQIVQLATKSRLPAIYNATNWIDSGGLVSYGSDPNIRYLRVATYVDKILKGAKPTDLPLEQPTKFELVINLKAAKQIGLTIPPNVLVRADKVIK
jgi:putative ABC transport system substrate-binding protein